MTSTLPAGWSRARLEEIASLVQYGTSAKTSDGYGVPVVRMGNIQNGEIVFDSLKYLPAEHKEFPTLILEPGDVLFNRTNSPELVGKSAVYESTHPSPASFASYLIRIRLTDYEPRLLCAYLNSDFGRDWIRSCLVQQVGQANVSGGKLKLLEVPIPPPSEQRQIVARLASFRDSTTRARVALDQVPSLAEELRQSALAAAYSGDLTRDWRVRNRHAESGAELLDRVRTQRQSDWEALQRRVGTKRKYRAGSLASKKRYEQPSSVGDVFDLPTIPEAWAWTSLESITHNFDGTRVPIKLSERKSGPYDYYGASGPIDKVSDYLFDGEYLLVAEDGANLLSRSTPIAFPADGRFWVNNHAHILQTILLQRSYLRHYLNSINLAKWVTGSAQPKLTQKNLNSIPIPVCSTAESAQIVSRLDNIFSRLEEAENIVSEKSARLRRLEQAIVGAAFGGELSGD